MMALVVEIVLILALVLSFSAYAALALSLIYVIAGYYGYTQAIRDTGEQRN